MTQIMAGAGLLGAPAAGGGYGDEQAMRITLLAALLGRRINEICMLDPDPLLPLLPLPGERSPDDGGDGQAPAAKLRYQQTKIDGAPNTVLVHDEVVAIIREQQQWAAACAAAICAPGTRPKYLFLAAHMNRNGDRPYSDRTLRGLLTRLAARLGIRRRRRRAGRFQPDPPLPAYRRYLYCPSGMRDDQIPGRPARASRVSGTR